GIMPQKISWLLTGCLLASYTETRTLFRRERSRRKKCQMLCHFLLFGDQQERRQDFPPQHNCGENARFRSMTYCSVQKRRILCGCVDVLCREQGSLIRTFWWWIVPCQPGVAISSSHRWVPNFW